MLPITLEPRQEINLFPKYFGNVANFELGVVNKLISAEIRLYFTTSKKEKVIRPTSKKLISRYKTIFLF